MKRLMVGVLILVSLAIPAKADWPYTTNVTFTSNGFVITTLGLDAPADMTILNSNWTNFLANILSVPGIGYLANSNGWTGTNTFTFLPTVNGTNVQLVGAGGVETWSASTGMVNIGTTTYPTGSLDSAAAASLALADSALQAASTQNLITVTQLSAATNSAIIDATNRVAGVGYLLPESTNTLLGTVLSKGYLQAGSNVSVLVNDRNYVANGSNNWSLGGGTFTGGVYSLENHLINAPESNELVTAEWVRSLAVSGQEWYFTDTLTNFEFGAKTTNTVLLSTTIPVAALTNSIASPVASDTYLAGGVSTQLYSVIRSPVTFEMYLNRVGGNVSTIIPVHPEVYYIYNGTTNHLGDFEVANQTIRATNPTKYTWTVSFADPVVTSAVYLVAYLKSGTVSGTAAGLNIVGGYGFSSYLGIDSVIEGESAAEVLAALNAHTNLTTSAHGGIASSSRTLTINGASGTLASNLVFSVGDIKADGTVAWTGTENGGQQKSTNWSVIEVSSITNLSKIYAPMYAIEAIDFVTASIYDPSGAGSINWNTRQLAGAWTVTGNLGLGGQKITNTAQVVFNSAGVTNQSIGFVWVGGTNYFYTTIIDGASARTNLWPQF